MIFCCHLVLEVNKLSHFHFSTQLRILYPYKLEFTQHISRHQVIGEHKELIDSFKVTGFQEPFSCIKIKLSLVC